MLFRTRGSRDGSGANETHGEGAIANAAVARVQTDEFDEEGVEIIIADPELELAEPELDTDTEDDVAEELEDDTDAGPVIPVNLHSNTQKVSNKMVMQIKRRSTYAKAPENA